MEHQPLTVINSMTYESHVSVLFSMIACPRDTLPRNRIGWACADSYYMRAISLDLGTQTVVNTHLFFMLIVHLVLKSSEACGLRHRWHIFFEF